MMENQIKNSRRNLPIDQRKHKPRKPKTIPDFDPSNMTPEDLFDMEVKN